MRFSAFFEGNPCSIDNASFYRRALSGARRISLLVGSSREEVRIYFDKERVFRI